MVPKRKLLTSCETTSFRWSSFTDVIIRQLNTGEGAHARVYGHRDAAASTATDDLLVWSAQWRQRNTNSIHALARAIAKRINYGNEHAWEKKKKKSFTLAVLHVFYLGVHRWTYSTITTDVTTTATTTITCLKHFGIARSHARTRAHV